MAIKTLVYGIWMKEWVHIKFNEIKPACGDDFVNIRIEDDNLINTIYDDNTPKSCAIPLRNVK